MESVVIQEVVEYLLAHYFRSKKELASEICISYRTLLNCYTGKGTQSTMSIVSARLIRYCVENRIMLGEAIRLPA